MFARMITYTQADPSPHRLEEGVRRITETFQWVRQLDGIEGAYYFVDRKGGKVITITLWESEEAVQRSLEVLAPLRAELSKAFAADRVDTEYYEVGEMHTQEIRQRELVEQELEVARSIQQASLPKEVPTLEGWQISPFYRPAREVGGDFYDFHFLSEGRVGLVVGDATGKGVPAALVMSTTLGMIQLAAGALDSSSPGEVLSRVNETLFARIPPNMFVTCFYAILDPESATLSYANAGHDLSYVLRGSGSECEELRARGMPLGLMPQMSYEEKEIRTARASSGRASATLQRASPVEESSTTIVWPPAASRQSPATKSSLFTSSITLRSEACVFTWSIAAFRGRWLSRLPVRSSSEARQPNPIPLLRRTACRLSCSIKPPSRLVWFPLLSAGAPRPSCVVRRVWG